jgi:hypothetical protein
MAGKADAIGKPAGELSTGIEPFAVLAIAARARSEGTYH